MSTRSRLLHCLAATLVGCLAGPVHATMGLAQIPETPQDGPVTLFYPSDSSAQTVRRGPFTLAAAPDGVPKAGNGRVVVISHGSGGGPWVHSNLARALVEAGFVVVVPEHRDDNARHDGKPGPDSWKLRPAEVSRAIDAVGRHPTLAPLLQLDQVGVYGMSAGGHTALSLAGGSWSPGNFRRHCEAHIADDFNACVGLATRLSGGMLDGVKKSVALGVIGIKFNDDTPQTHTDARVAAVVAAVPFAADFDMASLAAPRVPLALVTAGRDRWLTPRFHSDRVLQSCTSCERLADLPDAGHGAYLSPLPPGFTGLVGDLLNDPPAFDRSVLPGIDRKVGEFFQRHLLALH